MKRDIRKLIADFDKKYGSCEMDVQEDIYSNDIDQILNIAIEKVDSSSCHPTRRGREILFYAIVTSWEAGIMIGSERAKQKQ